MKNRKKIIGTINELSEFPSVLNSLEKFLVQEIGNYAIILDGTNYPEPVSLLNIVLPDMLLFNLKPDQNLGIDIMGSHMEHSKEIKLGIITSDAGAYYMSLCSTFNSNYFIETSLDLELARGIISGQQLN